MMEFAELVRRRRMVRRYQPDRAVPAAVRDRLLDVARRSPSAGFSQGTSFLVLESAEDRELFWAATRSDGPPDQWLSGMRTAPTLIVVWTSEQVYRRRYTESDKSSDVDASAGPDWAAPFWFVDAGMAAMALLYAVIDADPELGACFFGVPRDTVDAVRDEFGVPAEQLPVGVISLGYRAPGETQSGSPRTRPRKPIDETVHHGRW